MFNSARLKLTAWYLLIIMLISIFFSVGIYKVLTVELNHIEKMQQERMERRSALEQRLPDEIRRQLPPPPDYVIQEIEDSKSKIKFVLGLINLAILILSAGAGYFLAGRTLRPIKEMVDEQNRFISDASHELRTPLTALKTSIEVNLRDKKMTLADARKLLKSNLEDVNGLQALSDNMLILANKENGKSSNRLEKIDLEAIINMALEKVKVLANQKNIQIKTKSKNVKFLGDKQELVRLLIILIDNAIKYSSEESKVEITGDYTSSQVIIEIKDKGVGIAEKDVPFIFDRFYRADKSRAQSLGYGLGLSIAKKIVNDHHGTIVVKSKVSSGTSFIIHLPIRQSVKVI